jgi:hypothetical protein
MTTRVSEYPQSPSCAEDNNPMETSNRICCRQQTFRTVLLNCVVFCNFLLILVLDFFYNVCNASPYLHHREQGLNFGLLLRTKSIYFSLKALVPFALTLCILYNQRDATYTMCFIIISALHVSGFSPIIRSS